MLGISKDNDNELDAVVAYNNAIKLALETYDHGKVDLLKIVLKMEENLIV